MSQNEDKFKKFLEDNKINYKYQYNLENCPFTKSRNHLVDFYLPDKNLYIEIKGFMTYSAVNQLKFISQNMNINFYILQMTEEDWIEEFTYNKHLSKANKFRENISIQFNEIIKLPSDILSDLSKKRLEDYLIIRSNDINKWIRK